MELSPYNYLKPRRKRRKALLLAMEKRSQSICDSGDLEEARRPEVTNPAGPRYIPPPPLHATRLYKFAEFENYGGFVCRNETL